MRRRNGDLLEGGTSTDLASDITFPTVNLLNVVNYAIQVTYTGSPNGTFKLQGSVDNGPYDQMSVTAYNQAVVNWTDIAGSAIVVIDDGSSAYTCENAGYNWVRLIWTASSGSGTITVANVSTKGA